jgi:hypothetical protein
MLKENDQMYNDVLSTLNTDPTAGMVSPPLLGSSGVVPLTSLSTLVSCDLQGFHVPWQEYFSCPDSIRHISNVIARAEREVFLATNFWKASDASKFVTNALRELSKRAGERGVRVVVKIIYDRGNIRQVRIEPHHPHHLSAYFMLGIQ